MHVHREQDNRGRLLRAVPADHPPEFKPRIDNREIFRALIANELRAGRLTPAHRRRLVRYAAGLRMSAVEAGRLVAECREDAARSADPVERDHALRLAAADAARRPSLPGLLIVALAAMLLYLLLLGRPW